MMLMLPNTMRWPAWIKSRFKRVTTAGTCIATGIINAESAISDILEIFRNRDIEFLDIARAMDRLAVLNFH